MQISVSVFAHSRREKVRPQVKYLNWLKIASKTGIERGGESNTGFATGEEMGRRCRTRGEGTMAVIGRREEVRGFLSCGVNDSRESFSSLSDGSLSCYCLQDPTRPPSTFIFLLSTTNKETLVVRRYTVDILRCHRLQLKFDQTENSLHHLNKLNNLNNKSKM